MKIQKGKFKHNTDYEDQYIKHRISIVEQRIKVGNEKLRYIKSTRQKGENDNLTNRHRKDTLSNSYTT